MPDCYEEGWDEPRHLQPPGFGGLSRCVDSATPTEDCKKPDSLTEAA